MSKLFTPYNIGSLTLKNRIAIAPMSQYSSSSDGIAGAWHYQHIGRLAISGAGMVILEQNGVTPDGRITPFDLGLWNDEQARAMREILSTVRAYSDTPIGIQLNHAGRKAGANPPWIKEGKSLDDEDGGWPVVAPSAIPYKPGWRVPKEIDESEMNRILDAWVVAAKRAYDTGFDFAELHSANGYLLNQFLSPLSNTRTDQYGGTAENRMRFPLKVAAAIRTVWPSNRPLGVRFNGSDFFEGGLDLDEVVEYATQLHKLGYDYLHVSGGYNIYNQHPNADQPGYMVPFADAVKKANPDATVITVGLIYQPEHANNIIEKGNADIVAIGRAFLDDPNWPIHAAISLDDPAPWPAPYDRFGTLGWPTHHSIKD